MSSGLPNGYAKAMKRYWKVLKWVALIALPGGLVLGLIIVWVTFRKR